ncbi:MAG: hypothetical protein Q7U37_03430 [Gallionella sp.]|nr:hypothetical protein [Gallionella sp.]MDP1939868.1 hypothetical protein [Gallionella sp.]
MFKRSTIFLGLMLTGSLAAAALVGDDSAAGVVTPVAESKPSRRESNETRLPVLQLAKLARAEAGEPEQDPFAGKSWYIPPPPPPPQKVVVQEAPKPTAPPLPFRYMGKIHEEGEPVVVYLSQGVRAYTVSQGDTIDNLYRVDHISTSQMTLTYLPLDIRQALSTSSPGMEMMADSVPTQQQTPLIPLIQSTENFPQ